MPAVLTWAELEPFDGNVLVVINSPDDDTDTVEALLMTLERQLPMAVLHVGLRTFADETVLAPRNGSSERVECRSNGYPLANVPGWSP